MSTPLRENPYLRLYRVALARVYSPGVPDVPISPPVTGTKVSTLIRVTMVSNYSTGPPDSFVVETTVPTLVDPLNPTGSDNVGWNGDSSGGTFNTLHTVPSGGVRRNCIFNCDVIMPADGTGVLENCIIFGGAPITSRAGAVTVPGGGTFTRCTWYGQPGSTAYYRNGVNQSGGTSTFTRCAFYRWVDMIHKTGGVVNTIGCLCDRFAFFDNDADHASGTPAFWTHNDFVQHMAGTGMNTHRGDLVWSRFDTTNVVWSGGSPGVGTASGGQIGMPATALNAGYWNAAVGGIYGNGYMFSNVSGQNGTILGCWLEGGNNSSSLMSFTTGTSNIVVAKRNKFGVGGYRGGLVRYLASWPSGTVADTGTGADVNVFAGAIFPSVPTPLRGTPVTVTSGGLRYNA